MELGYTYLSILQVEKLGGENKAEVTVSQKKTSPFLSQTQPWYNLTMLVKLKTPLLTHTHYEPDSEAL